MKIFITKLILFSFAIVLTLSVFCYATIVGLRKSGFGNLKEWRLILNGEIDADIIINGSSRAWVHFDVKMIDSLMQTNAYNFGMDGAAFDAQYIRYKSYINNNTKPRIVIQQVDVDLLIGNDVTFQRYQYLAFLNNKEFADLLWKYNVLSMSDIIFPFSIFMGEPKAIEVGLLEYFSLKHYSNNKYKGFKSNSESWDESKFKANKTNKLIWTPSNELKKLFEQFLSECKDDNIKVVLVFSPYYYELRNRIADYDVLINYYSAMAKKYDAIFLDYSFSEISNASTNFYNATHLNTRGATLFTDQLIRDLKVKLR